MVFWKNKVNPQILSLLSSWNFILLQTVTKYFCQWGKGVNACTLAEEAVRSKTTVLGSSLSACAVIALGGEKGGLGEGVCNSTSECLCMCAKTVCDAVLTRLQACRLLDCLARRVNIDGYVSCHWVAPPGWPARLRSAHCLGLHSWGSRKQEGCGTTLSHSREKRCSPGEIKSWFFSLRKWGKPPTDVQKFSIKS